MMKSCRVILGSAVTTALTFGAGSASWGAEASSSASLEIGFLAEVTLLILVGRLLAEGMQRLGQPAVMGPLIGGLLMGPSALGALWPQAQHALLASDPMQAAAVNAFAQFGVLLLLLLAGMETELRLLHRIGRTAVAVSVAGIALPFACGFALGEMLPAAILPHPEQRLVAALFVSISLSISSVKIVAMVVREMNFTRRNVGAVILAASVIDDTIGWVALAVVFSLANRGSLDTLTLAQSTLGTFAFIALSMLVGRRLVPRLIRWANDLFVSEGAVIAVVLLLMSGMALITHWIGVHTVLGAFVAGMLVGESPMLTGEIDRQLRGIISALVVPVFFGLAGLRADLTMLRDPTLLGLTVLLIVIASLGKFTGAFLGGRIGGMTARESLALACGMNARGSTEVIVATIGLTMGILSQQLFTMIVTMAVVTTLAMPTTLRWALRRLPLRAEERARIDRDRFEERGFLANIERLLLAVDGSANAHFASRLVGLIAGLRGVPVTVLHIGPKPERPSGSDPSTPEMAAEAGAKSAAESAEGDRQDVASGPVDITSRSRGGGLTVEVAEEAAKGYGLLAIGVKTVTTSGRRFHRQVAGAAAGFDGSLMIVRALNRHLTDPESGPLRIVLPVTGTEVSRRAAEIAVALARAANAPIIAISATGPAKGKTRSRRRTGARRAHEDAILKDVEALARRYGASLDTSVHADVSAAEAIMAAAAEVGDLIVMGAERRAESPLYLGEVAATVLQDAKASVALITNWRPAPGPKTLPASN
jgi:Kef-type K+ transport system membrane component KefB/nucleotide-binding universal stress UspA family protein